MKKLISMTDFVLEQSKLINDPEILARVLVQHAVFLEQELNLGMFVPAKFVNGEWIILKEPNKSNFGIWIGEYEKRLKEYQEAKDRVLFEGFRLDSKYIWHEANLFMISDNIKKSFENRTIEFLLSCYKSAEIVLTESAKKQIGI